MAEIPTFQEMDKIDLNGDGQMNEDERKQYATDKVDELRGRLRLTVNGKPVGLKVPAQSSDMALLPGQAGLQILRLSTWFEASLPQRTEGQRYRLFYSDDNYSQKIGWKEVVVRPSDEVSLLQSSVTSDDQSNELLNYPQDLLKSPLAIHQAQMDFEIIAVPVDHQASRDGLSARPINPPNAPNALSTPFTRQDSRFTSLITKKNLTVPVILLSFLAAALWGAMHVLSPGHGKTIVTAYLVGSRATFRHALFLGLIVTVTHTLSVFALGLVTLSISRYVLPEDLFPWLSLASGLLVVGLGLWLLRSRVHQAGLLGWWRQRMPRLGLAIAGGGAHAHEHEGEHHRYAHSSSHSQEYSHDRSSRETTYLRDSQHSHEDSPITWKSLLTLGISGGLLPCPSAMLIMLSAISLSRTGLGLILVIAFSVGLAGAMTCVGLLALYGRQVLGRMGPKFRWSSSPLGELAVRLLPLGSAAFISIIGLVMTARALTKM
jgi:ABC-type nickel/cobalt efflux system permease component RcnA